MSLISFDIVFKNKIENDSIKLLPECEFQQLKLMICGKYKIYDLKNIFIYYKGNLIIQNDSTKLKNIFKSKKIKLEISETPLIKIDVSQTPEQYTCICEAQANYICDTCSEFLCESCTKKKKHISHNNKIIKITDYKNYLKSNINSIQEEFERKILNDETYLFFQFWNYDVNSELSKIDNTFEFVKKELEDIKKILIDYVLAFSEINNYEKLKNQIDYAIRQYTNINLDNDVNMILEEKRKTLQLIQDTFDWYDQLKNQLFTYNKAIKDIQNFNQTLIKNTKDKYSLMLKKYEKIPSTPNIQNALSNGNFIENSYNNNKNDDYCNSLNIDYKVINGRNTDNQLDLNKLNKIKNNYFNDSFQSGIYDKKDLIHNAVNNIFNNNMPIINNQKYNEKMLFKVKDSQIMIIFSLKNQTFKEINYIDKSNFSKEINEKENDAIIQLNLNNKLYLLSGKKNNKLYYYDYETNTLNYIGNTIYEHNYGAMVYCQRYNAIYILGGENQTKCEISYLKSKENLDLKVIPSLNEERQKFASMYFNQYIYVFFGYSIQKGKNLSSIERINININDKFEVVYVNEQITLCSLACTELLDETDNKTDENIILLGGFDGKNYLDSSLILNINEMKIRDWDIVIPNLQKHNQFLFHIESTFIDYNSDIKLIYDSKNNVHLLSKDSYELFSEVQ